MFVSWVCGKPCPNVFELLTVEEGEETCKAKDRRSETQTGVLTSLQVMGERIRSDSCRLVSKHL